MSSFFDAMACAQAALRAAPYQDGRASVQALKAYVERHHSESTGKPFTILIRKENIASDAVRGLVLRYTDHAVVHVAASLNTCWTRFVVIKELMHLLVDDDSSFIDDIVAQLKRAQDMFSPQVRARQVGSEDFAMAAAMEYAFAASVRPAPPVESTLAIATRFLIPHALVEAFYNEEWSDWSELGVQSLELNRRLVT